MASSKPFSSKSKTKSSINLPNYNVLSKIPNSGSGSTRSPEPNCSICLGKIEEESFANKCFHCFCKTCLFEWSKVKAECPVCRQPFDTIIYNVKAMDDYKEFKVMPKYSNRSFFLWNNIDGIHRIIPPPHIPFSSSLRQRFIEFQNLMGVNHTPSNTSPRSVSVVISSPLESSAMQFNSSSSQMNDMISLSSNEREIFHPPIGTCAYRRYLYDSNLWVMPYGTKERECSASFYRKNPACTHRLLPWLNHELLAILDNPYDCESVTQIIMKALNQYDIPSFKFRQIVQPYTLDKTHHFLHEFYYFAKSVHETMETYNQNVMYVPKSRAKVLEIEKPCESFFAESSDFNSESSDSVKILDYSSSSSSEEFIRQNKKNSSSVSQKELDKAIEMIEKADKKKNTTEHSLMKIDIIEDFDNPTPGPSGLQLKGNSQKLKLVQSSEDDDSDKEVDNENKNFSSYVVDSPIMSDYDSDNSVKIVGCLKPRHERTPEIIDIISENEQENEKEIKLSSCGNKSNDYTEDDKKNISKHNNNREGNFEVLKKKVKKHRLEKRKQGSKYRESNRHSWHSDYYQNHKEKRKKCKGKHSSKSKSNTHHFKPRSFIGMARLESSSSNSDSEPMPRKFFLQSIILTPNQS